MVQSCRAVVRGSASLYDRVLRSMRPLKSRVGLTPHSGYCGHLTGETHHYAAILTMAGVTLLPLSLATRARLI